MKKKIKRGSCVIEIEGNLEDDDKPRVKIRVSGDCSNLNLDKLKDVQ